MRCCREPLCGLTDAGLVPQGPLGLGNHCAAKQGDSWHCIRVKGPAGVQREGGKGQGVRGLQRAAMESGGRHRPAPVPEAAAPSHARGLP